MKTNDPNISLSSLSSAAVVFVVSFLLAYTGTAEAHTSTSYYSYIWSSDPNYSLGFLGSPLNTSAAKTSIHTGNDEWNAVSGSTLDFNWSGTENSSVVWMGNACSTAPSNGVWVLTNDISPLALTNWCVQSGTTILTKATIRLDQTRSNWYTGSSTTVPSGNYDLRSVIVHEFGHAGGFTIHFAGSGICTGSTMQTMCSSLPSGTSYKRTLEEHDEHTVAGAY